MSTYFSPGCKDEKAHVCDSCEVDDGRESLYWEKQNFDLCLECLKKLCVDHLNLKKFSSSVKVVRARISEELRNKVFERDGRKCVLCGSGEKLCVDHIHPFSLGGKTEESNFQTLCKSCNSKKGNR